MIAIPGNVRVWLATGHTDMRRGFRSLVLLVQENLKRYPHDGDLYVFRGRQGDLIKVIWWDGQGAPVHEAIGARPFSLAVDGRWGGYDPCRPAVLSSLRDRRLAHAAGDVAPESCRIICG